MDLIIDGRYQLLKRLDDDVDNGRSSALFVASDLKTGRVACLRLWSAGAHTRDFVIATPPGEQPHISPSDDPRIVSPFDWGIDNDVVYLARDYVAGRSLTELVEHEGPLSLSVASSYALQIAETVAAAHAKGLGHGRLRPSQVLIDNEHTVHLVGFEDSAVAVAPPTLPSRPITGFAPASPRARPDAKADDQSTPPYEHAVLDSKQQHDVYALGALYYYMLTNDDRLTSPSFLRGKTLIGSFAQLRPASERSTIPKLVDEAVAFLTTADGGQRLPSIDRALSRVHTVDQQLLATRRGSIRRTVVAKVPPTHGSVAPPPLGRQVLTTFAELQGHIAIALMIALAAGLFLLTVDRGRTSASVGVSPTARPSAAPTVVAPYVVAPVATASPVPAINVEPTLAPTTLPTEIPTEMPPTVAPESTRPAVIAKISQTSVVRRVASNATKRPIETTTPTVVHTAVPTSRPVVRTPASTVRAATTVSQPTSTPDHPTAPPANLATPAPGMARPAG